MIAARKLNLRQLLSEAKTGEVVSRPNVSVSLKSERCESPLISE